MSYNEPVVGSGTVSDKIRQLDRAGMPRAEIARTLGKRYQHVRNVLEADKALAKPASEARPTAVEMQDSASRTTRVGDVLRMQVGDDFSVQIPADLVAEFGFKPGQIAIGRLSDGRLTIYSHDANLREIRASLPQWKPGDPLWSEALIEERRRESASDGA